MKFNKWTLGLAAVGAVSLTSAARADEMNAVQTALSSTAISGYIDTSFEWQIEPDKEAPDFDSWPAIPFRNGTSRNGDGKRNGFNLNVVQLTIAKPMDESEWAAGYRVDLLFGPDAVGFNPSANVNTTDNDEGALADVGIRQAYVALRTPIGNGIDWKFGVFTTILGYESFESGNNPNFTRSWGWALEATQHTGILGTYRVNDNVVFSAGLANTHSAGINNRDSELSDHQSEWRKTWMASLALTAPESMGALAGSTLYLGAVGGYAGMIDPDETGSTTQDQVNFYAGATIATPVTGLRFGVAFDYVDNLGGGDRNVGYEDDVWNVGLYASYQATEKLSLHLRGEYGNLEYNSDVFSDTGDEEMWSLTATLQYALWANVISRIEVRYDDLQVDGDSGEFSYDYDEQHLGVFANVIYKF